VVALFRNASGRHEGFAAWTLLFYALWHRAHIEARAVDGDVWDVLAAAA
jgi:asparagine synthase (glutamine-hydrolysing)